MSRADGANAVTTMIAPITQESFEAFLKCPRKSHLVSDGAVGAQPDLHDWQRRLEQNFKVAASARLRSSLRPNEWYVGTPPGEGLHERRYRLVFDYTVAEPDVHARLHALEVDCSRDRARHHCYIPIRFVPKEKVTASDKLMLAFDAYALSRATGELPTIGKIVHGCRCSPIRLPLPKLLQRVRSVIEKIVKHQAELATPPVVLNRYCAECQFQTLCRQIARKKDDLSLLGTISDKERKKFHEKGIFTVTQLSYAFRPRRRSTPGGTKCIDHGRVGDDHLEHFVGPGGRDHRPVLVSPEVGERDSARRFQRVLILRVVLRVNGRGDEDAKHCHGCRNDGEAGDTFHGGACFYLLFLLFLRHRFRHKLRHGLFSFTKKTSKPNQRSSLTIAIRPDMRQIKQLDNCIGHIFVRAVPEKPYKKRPRLHIGYADKNPKEIICVKDPETKAESRSRESASFPTRSAVLSRDGLGNRCKKWARACQAGAVPRAASPYGSARHPIWRTLCCATAGKTKHVGGTEPTVYQPKAAPRPLYMPGAKPRIPAEPVTCERICGST